ncbi:hematopoietic prostaglandin D synthase-like [Liolophura sinensis]|uniref:hematopoietic prostaglandin D synthase-like n=1 Tax=Liolophura sinensis TaxID=3198878 RepID=UPI003158309A
MPVYKLYYFNARARAEGIRWLMSLAGVEFEDIRIDRNDWPTKKQEMPFGYVPVLEVEGQRLSESQAIARYLANKFDLAGKTDWEKALADQYVDVIYDILPPTRAIRLAPNEEVKAQRTKNFIEVDGPRILANLERCLESSRSEYLVGDSLTWADVMVASYLDLYIDRITPDFGDLLDKFPKLQAHLDRIRTVPQIAAFIAKRPKTFL